MKNQSDAAPARLSFAVRETRLAPVLVVVDSKGHLVRLRFLDPQHADTDAERTLAPLRRSGVELRDDPRACAPVVRQVKDFVAGKRDRLDLASVPQGTEFQQRVWKELRKVPYGATVSYAELARRIGRPSAVRATARANATNPVALLVPCHRVIGKDGAVTGYNGGVAVKKALLELEAKRR